ncbi:hypothetical protein [uncultured Dechloromonas sp.]|uniref:hypothetical protein n=1 Tax=uncultured Dechloromonas sp. TaxID=171719 RepID=UPI0025CCAB29|nr:hypothetical protein [uncultured Dechloromonas sp.]
MDILISGSLGRQSGAATIKQSNGMSDGPVSPEMLSGMELVHAVYSEEGGYVIGSPTAGFAYFVSNSNTLVVVSESDKNVQRVSLNSIMTTHAMEVAQEMGASFIVHGAQVICNICGVSQAGGSYGEAALRAMLAYSREQNS